MCKVMENYANEYAMEKSIDAVIKACLAHKDSLDETINFVKAQFPNVTTEYIGDRFKNLSQA